MEQKTIQDYSVVELKAILFDLDQNMKNIQNQMQSIAQVLSNKLKEQDTTIKESKPKKK
jgi:hypothetical protein